MLNFKENVNNVKLKVKKKPRDNLPLYHGFIQEHLVSVLGSTDHRSCQQWLVIFR